MSLALVPRRECISIVGKEGETVRHLSNNSLNFNLIQLIVLLLLLLLVSLPIIVVSSEKCFRREISSQEIIFFLSDVSINLQLLRNRSWIAGGGAARF